MPTYTCKICDYETDRKSSIDVHNISKKHLKNTEFDKLKNLKNKNKLI